MVHFLSGCYHSQNNRNKKKLHYPPQQKPEIEFERRWHIIPLFPAFNTIYCHKNTKHEENNPLCATWFLRRSPQHIFPRSYLVVIEIIIVPATGEPLRLRQSH